MAPQDGLSPTDRLLRKTSIITYPFALFFGVLHTSMTGNLLPGLGLIPMTFSTALSWALYNDGLPKAHVCPTSPIATSHTPKHNKRRAAAVLLGDFLFGSGLLICVVMSLVCYPRAGFLAAYATVPFIINTSIYIIVLFRAFFALLSSFRLFDSTCSHCHHCLPTHNDVAPRWRADKKTGYTLLDADETNSLYHDGEEQSARPSIEGQETGVTDNAGDTAREITGEEGQKIIDV